MAKIKKTVIFACVHNAGRSQMAAAFFNRYIHPEKASALSAGTDPDDQVHPEVIQAMKEVGIDLSKEKPTLLTEDLAEKADFFVTMGCGEKCPNVKRVKIIDWEIRDPKNKDLVYVKQVRDEIKDLVLNFIKELH